MKRADSRDQRSFPVLFRKGRNLSPPIKEIEEAEGANEDVLALLEFIKSSKRGVCLGA
jgi:acyl-[acyl carrier protein]--UDP-N-acetylglucosamine O-acyltransferase